MKKSSSLLFLFCLGIFLSATTACDPNPGEVRKTSKADINPPTINDGTTADFK